MPFEDPFATQRKAIGHATSNNSILASFAYRWGGTVQRLRPAGDISIVEEEQTALHSFKMWESRAARSASARVGISRSRSREPSATSR